MTSRAVLLPYPGDPFLLRYWLDLFNRVWGKEIDHLYIHLNSPIEKPAVDYIRKLCDDPKITLKYTDHQIEHGDAIDELLDMVKENYIALIEDDFYIFKPGMVDRCFRFIEMGTADIVGSKRGSCSDEISQASKEKYNLDYSGYGDTGCNFWPSAFFSTKKLLLETDRDFKARAWQKGETIAPLDHIVEADTVVGDTFVNTSIQLLAKVPQNRIIYIPQYHGSPDDLMHYQKGMNLWDGKAPWVHVGSLSSGIGGAITDPENRSLARRMIDEPKKIQRVPINSEAEKKEWERRIQWWLTFWKTAQPVPKEIQELSDLYHKALMKLIGDYELSENNIRRRQNIYKELGL